MQKVDELGFIYTTVSCQRCSTESGVTSCQSFNEPSTILKHDTRLRFYLYHRQGLALLMASAAIELKHETSTIAKVTIYINWFDI